MRVLYVNSVLFILIVDYISSALFPGTHYSQRWALEDLMSEQREGSEPHGRNNDISNITPASLAQLENKQTTSNKLALSRRFPTFDKFYCYSTDHLRTDSGWNSPPIDYGVRVDTLTGV